MCKALNYLGFDSFGIKYISQKVINKIKDKSITHIIFRIQNDDSAMFGFYCIAFLEQMIAGKTLSAYNYLFPPNDYKNSGKIIYKYFKDKYGKSWF